MEPHPRGIWVGVYCPGWVRTDMGGPQAALSPAESVVGLRQHIAELGPETTGASTGHDGQRIGW